MVIQFHLWVSEFLPTQRFSSGWLERAVFPGAWVAWPGVPSNPPQTLAVQDTGLPGHPGHKFQTCTQWEGYSFFTWSIPTWGWVVAELGVWKPFLGLVISLSLCLFVCLSLCVCMYVCMCVCVCVCLCVYSGSSKILLTGCLKWRPFFSSFWCLQAQARPWLISPGEDSPPDV